MRIIWWLSQRLGLLILRAEGLVNLIWGNNTNKISKEWPHEESENYNLVKREHVAAEKQSGQLKAYQPCLFLWYLLINCYTIMSFIIFSLKGLISTALNVLLCTCALLALRGCSPACEPAVSYHVNWKH